MNDIIENEQGQEMVPAPGKTPRRSVAKAAPAQHMLPAPRTPMDLVASAVDAGRSVEEIDKLIALAERMERRQAEQAFNAAKAAFAAENITITKDKANTQYGSMYTTIGNLVNTVRPFLGKHGLAADWKIDQSNGIEVTCILSHSMGHSNSVSLKVPPDTSGAKNPLQQIKSSITYARSATFEAVCGLASTDDANLDDDGNGSGINRNAVQEAVQQSRGRAQHKPADIAAQRGNGPAPDAELLAQANAAAARGTAHFGPYWRGLSQTERDALAPKLSDLQRTASASGK
jgi:hypothetical protein